ncbi:MAG TPA: hypothetical protein VLE49_14255 [Anaerolineales bacterium]|nr:hypothetical protein [Anaerolineales bacterium]
MDTQFTNQSKPTLVNVIAWMTLVSGIVNLFWGLGFSLTVILGSLGIGILCLWFTILPTILGIFEIIYAAKLLSNPPQAIQPSTTIAILEIVCVLAFNLFSVVVGILSLVFYNDTTVRDYFARLNGALVPAEPVPPLPPVAPTPVPEPEPTPVTPEEIAPVEEPPAPAPEETPEKPKRSRKVAGK